MNYDELTANQKAKLSKCTTAEEVLQLAKEEGRELTDDELEMIAGGADWHAVEEPCPYCKHPVTYIEKGTHFCLRCYRKW